MVKRQFGKSIFGSGEFFQKTLDCLRSHIAILDVDGTIIAVNATWNAFATSNGLAEAFCGPGVNYLRSCDTAHGACSEEAQTVAAGIRAVVAGQLDYFDLEYPCHSLLERRWFSVRVTRFEIDGSIQIVVAHDNITRRKLAEIKLKEANRLLRISAGTDALTGIANRASFDKLLALEWRRHKRSHAPLSVAMVDVDCFKQFNDDQGHLAGDACLRLIAQTIKATVERAGDSVARFGGEEFAIILPNTDASGAATVLGDALRRVRQLAIPHPSSMVAGGVITVSIGSATTIPLDAASAIELLNRADAALYRAKDNGRGQLVSAADVHALA